MLLKLPHQAFKCQLFCWKLFSSYLCPIFIHIFHFKQIMNSKSLMEVSASGASHRRLSDEDIFKKLFTNISQLFPSSSQQKCIVTWYDPVENAGKRRHRRCVNSQMAVCMHVWAAFINWNGLCIGALLKPVWNSAVKQLLIKQVLHLQRTAMDHRLRDLCGAPITNWISSA